MRVMTHKTSSHVEDPLFCSLVQQGFKITFSGGARKAKFHRWAKLFDLLDGQTSRAKYSSQPVALNVEPLLS